MIAQRLQKKFSSWAPRTTMTVWETMVYYDLHAGCVNFDIFEYLVLGKIYTEDCPEFWEAAKKDKVWDELNDSA